MSLSRRRVIAWLGLLVAATAGYAWTQRRALPAWMFAAALGREPTGPLSVGATETMRSTVVALLDPRVETSHYLAAFRWRAMHVRGARAVYERWAHALDRDARRRGAPDFRRAPLALQRDVLARYQRTDRPERARRVAFDRDEARFARHVIREIFRRFARTDAWVFAGYAAWPGMPRALARLGPNEPPP